MKKKITVNLLILVMSVSAWAQSGGTFLIEKSVIAGGGGSAAGGVFALDGTIGQSVAGTSSSGGVFSVDSGFWAAAVAPSTISGTITYGNAVGAPTPRFVSNVTITGVGSPNVLTTTGPPGATAGQYALSGFGSGSYTVTPTKTTGANGITANDAARVAQHAAGPPNPTLNATQLIVADVSGNGIVSSFDAGMIAKFAAGPPFTAPGVGLTGTWRFSPVNRPYASVTSNVTGEDYTALLMGEVTGNWNNTGARQEGSRSLTEANSSDDSALPEYRMAVMAPSLTAQADNEIVIPISVQGKESRRIISYEFTLRYDPTVVRLQKNAIDISGTVSRSLTAVVNAEEPGLLRVVMYGSDSIEENGILVNLRFKTVGAPGSVSPLVWEKMIFNEGDPVTTVADGQIAISTASQIPAE